MENGFRNKILKLALPITAQQFMLALVSACDAFMLGGLNQSSLSAVSLAAQITFVFNLILTALTIGKICLSHSIMEKKILTDYGHPQDLC